MKTDRDIAIEVLNIALKHIAHGDRDDQKSSVDAVEEIIRVHREGKPKLGLFGFHGGLKK